MWVGRERPEQDQAEAQPLLLCRAGFARGVPLQRSTLELVPDLPGASGRQTGFMPPGVPVTAHLLACFGLSISC